MLDKIRIGDRVVALAVPTGPTPHHRDALATTMLLFLRKNEVVEVLGLKFLLHLVVERLVGGFQMLPALSRLRLRISKVNSC